MSAKVLFVDDEHSLEEIRRTLGRRLEVTFLTSARAALTTLRSNGPFEVVVSGVRLADMSGAQFLSEVRQLSPPTVRMLLAGQADLESTIAAVNDGQVFRFLTKPCPPETLLAAIRSALEQYRLVNAERELLEQTLAGAVKVLTDVLAIVDPEAYGRAARITRYADAMAKAAAMPDRWVIRLAAMFSQIGWVALPKDLVAKVSAGEKLTGREQMQFDEHRRVAARLISNIPRLRRVAAIVGGDDREAHHDLDRSGVQANAIVLMGRIILEAATEFERLISCGEHRTEAAMHVRGRVPSLPEAALEALAHLEASSARWVRRSVKLTDLVSGMVLDQHVTSAKGLRLVSQGQEVTPTLIARLHSIAQGVGVVEPIRVQVPAPQLDLAVDAAIGAEDLRTI